MDIYEKGQTALKKYVFVIFLGITTSFVLNILSPCFATDRLGCLTCHRYPGLVKFEEPDRFKVLHIDEEKHLNSPHSKVDCRQCHTPINKVPHTDETGVECTNECHVEDREKITAMQSSLSELHKDEKFTIISLEDKSSCRVCHPLYPHSKNIKARALINMHTGFLLCEVCHLKKENLKNITYDWKEPESVQFSGEPYGTHKKLEREETRKTKSVISRILRIFPLKKSLPEGTQGAQYVISRIAVFSLEEDKKTLLMNTVDTKKATEYKAGEKSLPPEKKEAELQYFHRDIARKEISVACNECHSPDGMLDFQKLGFDEKTVKDLQYLNIKSLLLKYDVFYLPNLF